jgi:hypothetical protein
VDDEVKAPDLAHLRRRGFQPLLHAAGSSPSNSSANCTASTATPACFGSSATTTSAEFPASLPFHRATFARQPPARKAAAPAPPCPTRWPDQRRRRVAGDGAGAATGGRPASPTATPGRPTWPRSWRGRGGRVARAERWRRQTLSWRTISGRSALGAEPAPPGLPLAVNHTVAVWLSITGGLPRLRFADLLAA